MPNFKWDKKTQKAILIFDEDLISIPESKKEIIEVSETEKEIIKPPKDK